MKSLLRKSLPGMLLLLTIAGCETSQPATTVTPDQIDAAFIRSLNDFAVKLHAKADELGQGDNLFLSPLSVSYALGMTMNGADGSTREEMANVLGIGERSPEAVNEGYSLLKELLEGQGKNTGQFRTANSMWVQKGLQTSDRFRTALERYYSTEAYSVDFTRRSALTDINRWVKKQTSGLIDTIMEEGPANAAMILINATYFKSDWKTPFAEANTRDSDFHNHSGAIAPVPMMEKSGDFEYKRSNGVQAIRLPYGNDTFSMLVMLPDEETTLEKVHGELAEHLEDWLQPYEKQYGTIKLPRFKLEYKLELSEALQALGMKAAFDPAQADFSRMFETPGPFAIDGVLHKAYLEVNEEGTKAAAVTAVTTSGSAPRKQEPFQMTVDRPFFLAIEDRLAGTLLFVGSVYEL